MAQVRVYEEIGVGVEVILPGKRWAESPLEIGEHGILAVPAGLQPAGFHLVLITAREARAIIAQKDVSQENGGYFRRSLDCFRSNELVIWTMHEPIRVSRAGQNVWTVWHSERPNRVDCWLLKEDGRFQLWQVGVVTHDDGLTFRLLVEPRWTGQIFKAPNPNGGLMAKPDNPKWGKILWSPGESRRAIREHPKFQSLLASANLPTWNGLAEDLDPPLGKIPLGNFARVDWYIPFSGQKGQGIAKLADGSAAWVSGESLDIPPDEDGIKRLFHCDLISFAAVHQNWGTKEGPPKLIKVKREAE